MDSLRKVVSSIDDQWESAVDVSLVYCGITNARSTTGPVAILWDIKCT